MVECKSIISRIRLVVTYVLLIILGLACFIPLWNVLCISLSSQAAVKANMVTIWPVNFTLISYEEILKEIQFWRSFGVSVIRVVLSLSINLILVILMAYPLTKTNYDFRGRNIYMYFVIFAMLFSGGMIPCYLVYKKLGILNTIWALVLPGAVPPFSIIMLMNFFAGVPKSLEEAAFLDGATPIQALLQVFVPCAKPAIATVALLSIVTNWNDFFGGLIYITHFENYPLMTYIHTIQIDLMELMKSGAVNGLDVMELSNETLNAAKIIISMIPLLLIYPFLQKYLLTGMVMGAVKE